MAINIDYTAIDFDALKSELIQYLRETQTFKDADIAASNINTLVGLYSYIGSLFGYYTNSIANEVFLPSAKRYKNLNRIARLLAYNPRGDKSSSVDVVGSLNPEYTFGKEDTTFEIPAYSVFPSNKTTPDGQSFVFTNPKIFPYSIKSFGVKAVEQSDFTYAGFKLPLTQNIEFWTGNTEATTATPVTFNAVELELTASDTIPLSILDRQNPNNFKGFDTDSAPLFDPQDASSVGQPFTRNINTDAPPFTLKEGNIYYIIWNYNSDLGSPFLSILEEGEKLEERRNDIITAIRLDQDSEESTSYTLREIQSNAKERFYKGVLGLRNLGSASFEFDVIEGTENSIKQIHLDINKTGDKPPLQVLVDGIIYEFPSGRISSQTFNRDNWDVNVPAYNVNLQITSPNKPETNFDATMVVTTEDPGVNEITIAKVFPSFTDPETNTSTILKQAGEKFGDFQLIPEVELQTTAQKTGFVEIPEGITKVFVSFDQPFEETSTAQPEDYIISLTPEENVQVWFSGKTEDGFMINVEPNIGFVGKIYWVATQLSDNVSREIDVTFNTPIPQIDGQDTDYTVFVTPSDNVLTWITDKTSNGFKINTERSFQGTVSWSTFAFIENEDVEAEANAATLQRGSVVLSNENRSVDIDLETEFPNDSYGLHVIANQNVNVWYTNKTSTGFTLNVEPGVQGQVVLDWFASFSTEFQFQKHGMVNFLGQVSSSGTLPGLRFSNISETFKIPGLKQGNILFSFVNRNGAIDAANNFLNMKFTADRTSFDEMKFFIDAAEISFEDIRVFVRNEGNEWEEWDNASDLITATNINVGEKIFFVRVNEDKKIEISFGDGVNFGKNPSGKEIYVFGLKTVGRDGNVPPNSLADGVILSKEILGDDNISLEFESQFIQLIGLKRDVFFAADERTSPTALYDSEGTRLTSSELLIKQNTPAFGGNFPETTEELRANASTSNLRQNRIVSLADYKGYVEQAFSEYITKVQILSFDELSESGLLSEDELEKFWFNFIFIVALPKRGNIITKDQRDFIVNSLNNNSNAMATVEHELLSATLVPIDTRVSYKKNNLGVSTSIESQMRRIIIEYFQRENRNLGDELKHSRLLIQLQDIVGVEWVEMAWNRDDGNNLTVSDYDIDAVTGVDETVQEVKRKKILELLAKDPNLLTIVEPLLDVTDSSTGETTRPFSFNLKLNSFEFPILGDIIIESVE